MELQTKRAGNSAGIRIVLLIALFAPIGCQRSQPTVLGSLPNYLRPYSPGAPLVIPDAPTGGVVSMGSTAGSSPSTGTVSSLFSGAPSPSPAGALSGIPPTPTSGASDPTSFSYAAQISELERRARLLDENNRQLHSQLAQAQQQVQTYRERSDLMQQQLGNMSAQLQQARVAVGRPPDGTTSEATRRSGTRLTANTSRLTESGISSSMEPLRSLGYPLETNGLAFRLSIPADQLFQPGTSQWTASADSLLDRVSDALRTASPNGRLSVDSYTDNTGQAGLGAVTAVELTRQQSTAIQKYLVAKGNWPSDAITSQGMGSDLPIMDNQTPAGRAANRRIEFIISQQR